MNLDVTPHAEQRLSHLEVRDCRLTYDPDGTVHISLPPGGFFGSIENMGGWLRTDRPR